MVAPRGNSRRRPHQASVGGRHFPLEIPMAVLFPTVSALPPAVRPRCVGTPEVA